jgi:cytochrome c oxidase subunit 6a
MMNRGRSVVTVPKLGTDAEMQKEFGEIIRARVARQKQLKEAMGDAGEHHTKEVDEMWKWVRISLMIALPLCTLSLIKDIVTGEHAHRKEGPEPEYMKIRHKNFPWLECSDCDLFDVKCWRKCRADAKALKEEAPGE